MNAQEVRAGSAGDVRLHRQVQIGSNIIFGLLVAAIWGHWSLIGVLFLIQAGRVAMNVLGQRFLSRSVAAGPMWQVESTLRRSHNALVLANLPINILLGHLCRWPIAALAYMPFTVLITETYSPGLKGQYPAVVVVLSIAGSAWLDGTPVAWIFTFAFLAVIAWSVSATRATVLNETHTRLKAKHNELASAHTGLQQMQEALVQQEKLAALGTLSAGIAHEINNPLSVVISNVDLLEADLKALPGNAGLLREYIEEVLPATRDGLRRINTIISDLRRFARGDPEGMTRYDLNHEVAAALRISESETKHRCRIRVELGALPPMLGRPQQIVQVIVNLVVNAAQATRDGGEVLVTTEVVGDEVLLRVLDHGGGMTPEIQRKLFQPFFTTKLPGEGRGLGLSVAHGLVQAHGGRIEVDSKVGVGSRFTVHLPSRPKLPEEMRGREPQAPPRWATSL